MGQEPSEERRANKLQLIAERDEARRLAREARRLEAAQRRRTYLENERGGLLAAGARPQDLSPTPNQQERVNTSLPAPDSYPALDPSAEDPAPPTNLKNPEAPALYDPVYDFVPTQARAKALTQLGNYTPPEELEQLRRMTRPENALASDNNATPEQIEAFLEHYAQTGQWNQSAYKVGRPGSFFRALAKEDDCFNALVGEAVQDFREALQREVLRRGVEGVVKPVYGKEGLVGYERVYSDKLLELEMRAAWPDRYREQPGVSIAGGDAVKFGVLVVPGIVTDATQWEEVHGPSAKGLPSPVTPSEPFPAVDQTADDSRVPVAKVTRPVVPGIGRTTSR